MKKITVEVEPNSKYEHISVILTGLMMLKDEINLNFKDYSKNKNFSYSSQAGLELVVNGKKCYIDVADGYNNIDFIKKNIRKYYIYFKRSYSDEINKKYGFCNMLPLGLNYEVYDKKVKYRYSNQKELKRFFLNIFGKKVFNQYYLKDLEYNGIYNINNPKICFFTRLWAGKKNEKINEKRIELVRYLKQRYGKNFLGGIYKDKLSQKLCKDLIVDKCYTYKENYLKIMHECDICIATTGLHDSIGWKFSEYIMSGKAIISEKLNYFVPEEFKESDNYLIFDSPCDCIQKIDFLLENKSNIIKMSQKNIEYYNNYLRPDKMMMRVINLILSSDI